MYSICNTETHQEKSYLLKLKAPPKLHLLGVIMNNVCNTKLNVRVIGIQVACLIWS